MDLISKAKKYLLTNEPFLVTNFSILDSDGTSIIHTDKGITYYIRKDEITIHKSYQPDIDNLVTDENEIAYLVTKLGQYRNQQLATIYQLSDIIEKLE